MGNKSYGKGYGDGKRDTMSAGGLIIAGILVLQFIGCVFNIL